MLTLEFEMKNLGKAKKILGVGCKIVQAMWHNIIGPSHQMTHKEAYSTLSK